MHKQDTCKSCGHACHCNQPSPKVNQHPCTDSTCGCTRCTCIRKKK